MCLRYRVASVPIPGLPGAHVLSSSSAGDEGAASLASSSSSSSSAKDKVRAVGLLLAQHLRRVKNVIFLRLRCAEKLYFYSTLHVSEGSCTLFNCWLLLCAWTKRQSFTWHCLGLPTSNLLLTSLPPSRSVPWRKQSPSLEPFLPFPSSLSGLHSESEGSSDGQDCRFTSGPLEWETRTDFVH